MQSGEFFYIRRVDFGMTDGRIWDEAADLDGYDEGACGLIVLSIDSSKKSILFNCLPSRLYKLSGFKGIIFKIPRNSFLQYFFRSISSSFISCNLAMYWVHSFHICILLSQCPVSQAVRADFAKRMREMFVDRKAIDSMIQDLLCSVMLADWQQKPNRFCWRNLTADWRQKSSRVCWQPNGRNRAESAVRRMRVGRQQLCPQNRSLMRIQMVPVLSPILPYSARIHSQCAGILQTVCWLSDYFVYCCHTVIVCRSKKSDMYLFYFCMLLRFFFFTSCNMFTPEKFEF